MSFSFDIYVIQAIHGVVYGMLLFLVTAGLTLVYRTDFNGRPLACAPR
jgi:branched-subunit amino acid ABC-type transport system permease component